MKFPPIRSITVCDLIRREDSGKEILIGVYAGSIVAQRPMPLRTALSMRVELDMTGAPGGHFEFTCTGPDGKQVFKAELDVEEIADADPEIPRIMVLPMRLGILQFDSEGIYTVRARFNQNPTRRIYHFFVRSKAPPTDQQPVD